METEGERFRLYTRRALLLGASQAVLASVLAGRMYYLAVVESSQYSMLAEDNRVSMRILPPTRGEIMDRAGTLLATNRKDYRVFLIPEQVGDVDETLMHLQLVYPISSSHLNRIKRQITRQRAFLPVTIAENLTWEQFAKINVDSPHLPGIKPDAGETRFYPYGNAASHVVGYVGWDYLLTLFMMIAQQMVTQRLSFLVLKLAAVGWKKLLIVCCVARRVTPVRK